jgi:hypothetical protein
MATMKTTLPLLLGAALAGFAPPARDEPPAWAVAHRQKPMDAAETRAFMQRLARYVFEHHLKRKDGSEQRGMVYEYFDPARAGQFDQFVQGEALDTMHDGAWFAAALVTAHRATGDPYYRDLLAQWVLPFYCKMLNHSDTLFSARRNDARPMAHAFDREHAYQEGETGFVPYWWDDGGSVSLERRRDKNPFGPFACSDRLAGRPNPQFLLDGWSHGSSNHLAQDLGVMLQLAWLVFRAAPDEPGRRLAADLAEAARHLQECRMRHHGHVPMCDAPAALALGDPALLKHVPDQSGPGVWKPDNHYFRAVYAFQPGQRYPTPGFADDQQYRCYSGLARHGGELPPALAFRTVYDAYTEPLLYRFYCGDQPPPPGVNRFDLHPYHFKDGKPEDYRSDRKGPGGQPRPIGSRMGPQNLAGCGYALQLLLARPGCYRAAADVLARGDRVIPLLPLEPGAGLSRYDVAVDEGPTGLHGHATLDALELAGYWRAAEPVTVRVFGRPDGQGGQAILTLKPDRTITVANDRGEPLLAEIETGRTSKVGDKEFPGFTVRLPFTHVKGQKAWAAGAEWGRFSLRIGDKTVNCCLATPEDHLRAWLERELGGGLRTWEAIFTAHGYVPTGLGAGDWDRFSDSGGYAHLLNAATQWLLYLEGKNDWDRHRVPLLR